MKRSDLFIRLTAAVLFLAVISYVGVLIYNALMTTYMTTEAVGYSIEETIPLYGYIVREEEVILDAGTRVMPIVREGERVASGQAIAVELLSSEAQSIASEIRQLNLRIAQLEALGSDIEAAGFISVRNLSQAIHNRDFSRLSDLVLSIHTHIFTGDNISPRDELPKLKARLHELEQRSDGMRTIHTSKSGTFSQIIDGYEHISPQDIIDISPSDFEELFRTPVIHVGAGKLITYHKWFFVTVLDSSDVSQISVGRKMTVHFSGAYHAEYNMLVENIGHRENNQVVVVFSSVISIHEIAALRALRADLVLDTFSGIRIPKEAIHLDDDGTTYLFLQSGVRAERVDIEILHEAGDAYLVRDGAETGSPLRVGATIIVRANNLFHGKVVG